MYFQTCISSNNTSHIYHRNRIDSCKLQTISYLLNCHKTNSHFQELLRRRSWDQIVLNWQSNCEFGFFNWKLSFYFYEENNNYFVEYDQNVTNFNDDKQMARWMVKQKIF